MICANKERRLSCAHTAVPFHLKNCKWMQPPHLVPAGGVPVPPISALLIVGTRQKAWSANGGGWCLINTLPLPYAFPCIRTVYTQRQAEWPLVKVTMSGCLAEKKGLACGEKTAQGFYWGVSSDSFWKLSICFVILKGASSSTLTLNPDEVFFMNTSSTVESLRAFQIICDWQEHCRRAN